MKVILSDELPTLQRWSSFNFREWLRQIFSVLTTVPPEGRWAMTKKKAKIRGRMDKQVINITSFACRVKRVGARMLVHPSVGGVLRAVKE